MGEIFWVLHFPNFFSQKVSKSKENSQQSEQLLAICWQGHKDLNPEPTVLETAALPIELYPYLHLSGGPSGTRTQDRPVMSRLL